MCVRLCDGYLRKIVCVCVFQFFATHVLPEGEQTMLAKDLNVQSLLVAGHFLLHNQNIAAASVLAIKRRSQKIGLLGEKIGKTITPNILYIITGAEELLSPRNPRN